MPKNNTADVEPEAPAAPATNLYRVREGFVAHIAGRDPVEGGEVVELTEAEAELYAVQIELAVDK